MMEMSQQEFRQREPRAFPEEVELWGWVVAELNCHRLKGTRHDWLATLNRLWRKNLIASKAAGSGGVDPAAVPVLEKPMLRVVRETWGLLELAKLSHRPLHARHQPNCSVCPIIVLRWNGRDFLIDGHTRINCWKRDWNYGPHEVVVIAVRPGT